MKMFYDEEGNLVESNMLLKVSEMKYLEQIKNGHLYMKNLDFHRNNEQEDAGDKDEGLLCRFKEGKLGINGVAFADVKNARLNLDGKYPIFCTCSVKFDKIADNRYIGIISKRLLDVFSKDKINCGVIVILARDIFEQRIYEALSKLGLEGRFDDVNYTNDESVFDREEGFKAVFRKKERLSYQQEARLWINTFVEDNFVLDIGDLSDIVKILPIDTIDSDIKFEVVLNESNER